MEPRIEMAGVLRQTQRAISLFSLRPRTCVPTAAVFPGKLAEACVSGEARFFAKNATEVRADGQIWRKITTKCARRRRPIGRAGQLHRLPVCVTACLQSLTRQGRAWGARRR